MVRTKKLCALTMMLSMSMVLTGCPIAAIMAVAGQLIQAFAGQIQNPALQSLVGAVGQALGANPKDPGQFAQGVATSLTQQAVGQIPQGVVPPGVLNAGQTAQLGQARFPTSVPQQLKPVADQIIANRRPDSDVVVVARRAGVTDERTILDLRNYIRAQQGLPPLTSSGQGPQTPTAQVPTGLGPAAAVEQPTPGQGQASGATLFVDPDSTGFGP